MANPGGPYPGRQLFLGLTVDSKPCFAYLVTGRSPESRQRKATAIENTVKIGPLENITLDPLRFHYTAVKYDNSSGLAVVTNGLQTEAIYETYKLLFDVGTQPSQDFLAKLLDGANAEPDSLHTPRIGGVITGSNDPVFIIGIKTHLIGIKTHLRPAAAYQVTPVPGSLSGVSTYRGSLDNPEPSDPDAVPSVIRFDGKSPRELAKSLYDISAASYKGEDIRVCAVGGAYSGRSWDIAVVNRYQSDADFTPVPVP